jgi:hypothetical protein
VENLSAAMTLVSFDSPVLRVYSGLPLPKEIAP